MKKIILSSLAIVAMMLVSCKNGNKAADAAAQAAADGAEAAAQAVSSAAFTPEEIAELEEVEIELSDEDLALFDSFNKADLTLDELATGAADQIAASKPVSYALVAEKPTFKGGDANQFTKWVNKNIVYPAAAQEAEAEGTVFVQFVVDEEGNVGNVEVARTSGNEALDAEAVRVVKSSPQWAPGQQNNIPVKVNYTFPVVFKLIRQ
ncbi:MAG: energy transducer TonB [Bacteroidales bacterium]|nr:energy transducer TonB [Bacteroidales bacterium]